MHPLGSAGGQYSFIARACRRRLRLVDELSGPSGTWGLGGVNNVQ